MKNEHDEAHETRLAAVFHGDASDGEQRALSACPECRERLEELRSIEGLLESSGDQERDAILAEAETIGDFPGADRIESVLRAQASPGNRRPPWLRLGVLVAAVVLAVFTLQHLYSGPSGDDEQPDPIFMDEGDELRELSPSGEVQSFETFTWKAELPNLGEFHLIVWPRGSSEPLVEEAGIEEPRWNPTEAQRALLPTAIEWEVRVYDANKILIDSQRRWSQLTHAEGSADDQSYLQNEWSERFEEQSRRIYSRSASASHAAVLELIALADLLEPRVAAERRKEHAYPLLQTVTALAQLPHGRLPRSHSRVETLERARVAVEILDDCETHASLDWNLGNALLEAGRTEEAARVMERALGRSPPTVTMRAWLAIGMSKVERHRSDHGAAQTWLAIADASLLDETHHFFPHRVTRGQLHGQRVELFLELGLPDLALDDLEREREIADEGSAYQQAISARHRVRVFLALGRPDRAERLIEEIRGNAFFAALPDQRAQLDVDLGIAHAVRSFAEEDLELGERAIELLERALATSGLPGDDFMRARAWVASLQRHAGRPDEARESLSLFTGLYAGLDRLTGGQLETTSFAACEAANLVIENGGYGRLELTHLESAFERHLAQWGSIPPREGGHGFLGYRNRRHLFTTLVRAECHVNGEREGAQRALEYLARAQALGSLAREWSYEERPVQELARDLTRDGTGLLAYVPGTEHSFVLVVDGEGAFAQQLGSYHMIDALRRDLISAASQPVAGDDAERERREVETRERAGELSDVLLPAEVAQRVATWSGTYIVGLDLISYLPFELLPLSEGRTIGERMPIAYLPSLPVGKLLEEQADRDISRYDHDIALIAAPVHTRAALERWPELVELPLGPEDVRALGRVYPTSRVHAVWGPDATRAALSAPEVRGARCLQILAHGVLDPERERPAGLLLTGDDPDDPGGLWCEDVERLSVPPLVILAACGTARGPLRPGEDGVSHLGGAFLRAGARCVLLTPAKVELATIKRLTTRIHELLDDGRSPARALFEARNELEPSTLHSLIHIVGIGHRPLR